jgi:hypothetical protein
MEWERPPPWPLERWLAWATDVEVSTIEVTAHHRVREPRRLTDPLCTIVRGWIGQRLRDLRCLTRARTCVGCREVASCDYAQVFDRGVLAAGSDVDGADTPAFWLQGLPAEHAVVADARFVIRLHVVGPARPMLPYVDVALRDALVRLGVTPLASVTRSMSLASVTGAETSPPAVQLTARTPLRLRGDAIRCAAMCPSAPWFALLLLAGVRRLDRLRSAFGRAGPRPYLAWPPLDDIDVSASSLTGWHADRFSHRQRQVMPLSGHALTAVLRGAAVVRFLPLLRALSVTGVGKGTAMGFGELAVDELAG